MSDDGKGSGSPVQTDNGDKKQSPQDETHTWATLEVRMISSVFTLNENNNHMRCIGRACTFELRTVFFGRFAGT